MTTEAKPTSIPFDLYSTTRVVFGVGTLERLGELTCELGGQRVLLVTDPGLEKAGHPQRAAAILGDRKLDVFTFDRVQENPTTKHVLAGVEVARAQRIDFLIAVGGGSAMDCAKGINFLLTNGGKMQDYWGTGKAKKPMLPSIGVPTTAGTGSEAQSYALIADPVSHQKMACGDKKVAFRVAILDPSLTLTQPTRVTALTGIDAISHAIESFVCTRRNFMSQMLAREAWKLLEPNFETVLKHPQDLAARSAMQLGAHLAGAAIENSMLGATHALANPLTAHYGLPHGQAIAMMLPYVIRYNAECAEENYALLAAEAGLLNGRPNDGARALADRVAELATLAGFPARLSEVEVSRGMLTVLADEAAAQWTGKFNPRSVGYDELLRIYESAL